MGSPTITKGQTFGQMEQITNTKLHNLVDLATWAIASQATGDLIYFDGSNWVRLAIGTTGQTLKVAGGIPTWTT